MFSFNQQTKDPKPEQVSGTAKETTNSGPSQRIDYKNWQAEVYHRIAEMCWHLPKSIFDSVLERLSKEEQVQLAKAVLQKGHDCVYNAVSQGDSFFKMIADNPHLYPEEYRYLTAACISNGDLTWCKYFRPGIVRYEDL